MQVLVVERFRERPPLAVYRRLREEGRRLPAEVRVLASWVARDFSRCYQVMETPDEARLGPWMEAWRDLVEFELVPVQTSERAQRLLAPQLDSSA